MPLPDTILLVDASATFRILTEALLSATGCQCVAFENTALACDAMSSGRVLATFIDCQTVWTEGEPAREFLRQHRARREGPLILIASTETPAELLEDCWRAGADDCILRPIRQTQVQARIEAARHPPTPAQKHAKADAPSIILLGRGPFVPKLKSFLEFSGYHTASADDPADLPASALATTVHALIYLSDSERPNGVVTLKRIRGIHAALAQVPTILVTEPEPSVADKQALGVAVTFGRGVSAESLVAELNQMLHRSKGALGMKNRVPFFCPVEFREGANPKSEWNSGFSYNLSPDGLFIQTLVPIRPRTALELRIHLTTAREQLEGAGIVAWSNPYQPRHVFSYPVGMGVQFLGMSVEGLGTLRAICDGGSGN